MGYRMGRKRKGVHMGLVATVELTEKRRMSYKHRTKLAKKRPVVAANKRVASKNRDGLEETLADFSRVSARAMSSQWDAPAEDVAWPPK